MNKIKMIFATLKITFILFLVVINLTTVFSGIAVAEPYSNDPRYKEYFAEIFFFLQNKKYDSVIIKLNEMKQLYPNDPDVYRTFGIAYYYVDNFKEAINSFNKALSLEPGDAGDYLSLWVIYDAIGDCENAKENLLQSFDVMRSKEKFKEVLILEAFLKKFNGNNYCGKD